MAEASAQPGQGRARRARPQADDMTTSPRRLRPAARGLTAPVLRKRRAYGAFACRAFAYGGGRSGDAPARSRSRHPLRRREPAHAQPPSPRLVPTPVRRRDHCAGSSARSPRPPACVSRARSRPHLLCARCRLPADERSARGRGVGAARTAPLHQGPRGQFTGVSGTVKVNLLPAPSRESTVRSPSCIRAISRESHRPSPVPWT